MVQVFKIVQLSLCVQTPMFWITVQSYGESMGFENEKPDFEIPESLNFHGDFLKGPECLTEFKELTA